jgi:hypothetical protein
VFLSCGQKRGSPEVGIARGIARTLKRLGFDPYVAVEMQSLRGIVENVLTELQQSEYLVFVDLVRPENELKRPRQPEEAFRGSLFPHQELAIAAALDIPILGFQESGLQSEDGFVRYVQGNMYPFRPSDRRRLASIVGKQVRRRLRSGEWAIGWRRQLRIESRPGFTGPVLDGSLNQNTIWFHMEVHNDHRRRHAFACAVFATRYRQMPAGRWVGFPQIELKWDYVRPPTALVPAGGSRTFAPLRVTTTIPPVAVIAFNPFLVDYPAIGQQFVLDRPGDYILRVAALSQEFDRVERDFLFHLGKKAEDSSMRPAPGKRSGRARP